MRCFACDCLLPDDHPKDLKTDRFYCEPCFAPTTEVMLARFEKDFLSPILASDIEEIDFSEFAEDLSLEDVYNEEQEEEELPPWD